MEKILVIDDEKPTLSMFRLFLGAFGHEVLTAENGEEGLAAFERENPDIVITDIKMPGMDGIEVLSRIKAARPATEVIVITGHGDMDLAIKALNLDATDFINKPIQRKDLENALARAGERLKLAQASAEEVGFQEGDGLCCIDIRGNVTSRSEARLAAAFEAAARAGGKILLRFAASASINGAGIAILNQRIAALHRAGRPMALVGLSDNFRKVFDIVGITRLARVYDDEAAALASMEEPRST